MSILFQTPFLFPKYNSVIAWSGNVGSLASLGSPKIYIPITVILGMIKFACVSNKFADEECNRTFTNEIGLYTHMLFEHGFLMPVCSTGIDEKLFKDNMKLIQEFRNSIFELGRAKCLLKKRLLKSMYGKKADVTNIAQTNYFLSSLDNHNNHMHSRIEFVEHTKYDHFRDLKIQLIEKLKMKGIVNK